MGERLFVSVDLDGMTDAVARAQEPFQGAGGLSFVDPAQAHVTLKFLGDTDPDRIDDLVAALERAVAESGVDPFDATFGGYGVFPGLDYVSVVWLGVEEGSAALTALHEALEARTTAMGFDPAGHEFTPHVTLARMDHAGGKEQVQRVVRERDPDVGTRRVEAVRLTKSDLGPDGPEYSTVAAVPLGDGSE